MVTMYNFNFDTFPSVYLSIHKSAKHVFENIVCNARNGFRNLALSFLEFEQQHL